MSKKGSKKEKSKGGNMYESNEANYNAFRGCRFDCNYCVLSFKRQARRQLHICEKCADFVPHYHPERLDKYLPNTGKDGFIFVSSCGDISFCKTSFLKQIVARIEKEKNKTFLVQSKNPATFNRVKFPDNVLLGITLETNKDKDYGKISKAPKPSQRFKDFCKIKHSRKMLTIEPVVEFDLEILEKWVLKIAPELVWIGYNSKKGDIFLPEPDLSKVKELILRLKKSGIRVKEKTLREKKQEG